MKYNKPKNLSKTIVNEIRLLYASNNHTQQQLAKKYSISQSLVCKIINVMIHKGRTGLKLSGEASVRVGYKYGN